MIYRYNSTSIKGYIIRITLTQSELRILQELCKNQGEAALYKKLHQEEEKANNSKTIKKTKATMKATKVRQNVAREKIENSINMMRLFGEKITVYSVSKHANVSYNTANKYRDFIKQS